MSSPASRRTTRRSARPRLRPSQPARRNLPEPAARSAAPSRAPRGMTSSSVPLMPRITLARSRSNWRSSAVAGVLQGLLGDQEAQELGGVGGLDRVGGDAEIQRGKIDRREEAAAPAVSAVACLGVGIVIVVGSPVGFGHFRDRIDALEDVSPVALQVLGKRKHAAHPDDGHRNRGRGSRRIQFITLSMRRCQKAGAAPRERGRVF